MLCCVLCCKQFNLPQWLREKIYLRELITPSESCVSFWYTSAFSHVLLMPCLKESQLSLCFHTNTMHRSSKQRVQLYKAETGRVLNWLKKHTRHCPGWYLDSQRQYLEQKPEFTGFINKDMLWPIPRALWLGQKGQVVVTAYILWALDTCIELRTQEHKIKRNWVRSTKADLRHGQFIEVLKEVRRILEGIYHCQKRQLFQATT